mgnify:CR=1 FL=1
MGLDAFRYMAREHVLLGQLTEALKVRPDELPDRVAALVERLRSTERELERLRAGPEEIAIAERFEAAHDDYSSILVKALADRFAEAAAAKSPARVWSQPWVRP